MNEIQELCRAYQQHLSTANDRGDPVSAMKKKTVAYLLEKRNPQDVLSLLSTQTSTLQSTGLPKYENPLSYEQILRIRRSYWSRDVVMGLFLVLTFPISLPFLMIWSRITRGDINFFKPDGVIFVEKLHVLCEQAKAKPESAFLSIAKPNTSLRRKPVENYRSLLPRVDLKPSASFKLPDAPRDLGVFGSILADVFHPSTKLRDTGNPEALSFRVRPFSSSADSFVEIDILCKFRYIPNLSRATSLKLLMDLRPGYRREQTSIPTETLLETLETQELIETRAKEPMGYLQTMQSYFFRPKQPETFETVYAALKYNHFGYDKSARLAFSLARNDVQRILALEILINYLKSQYDHHCKKAKEEKKNIESSLQIKEAVESYQAGRHQSDSGYSKEQIEEWILRNEIDYKNKPLPFWEENFHRATYWAQHHSTESEKSFEALSEALNSLPANYHNITPSANQLQMKIDAILRLLEKNQIGDAELLYRQNRELSYFLEAAFPHFKAVLEQFQGMFSLVCELGAYSMIKTRREPEDAELVKNELLIYYKAHQIWVATRNSDNAVERFAIDSEKLGDKAENILFAFEQGETNYSHIAVLEPILAHYGYYHRRSQDVLVAKECFSSVYKQILTYDAELAERFKRETLAPVEALVDFGQEAKAKTPLEVQYQMIALLQNESIQEMLSGVVLEDISLMSDEAWDEVLADGAPTSQHDETASNRFGIGF